jgi:excisionase family DNA binding protein
MRVEEDDDMEQTLTLNEAARRLGVSRHKVWLLVRDGTLPARQNPLDKREKLIPVSAVEELAATGKRVQRPRPRSAGIVNEPSLQSSELEDIMLAEWHPK